MNSIVIRKWNESDDISAITSLLHRAYKQLADLGFKYYATWQSDDVTHSRLSAGSAFIAELDGKIVGTGTLYFPLVKARIVNGMIAPMSHVLVSSLSTQIDSETV